MILQALVELATNEKLIADPDYEFKPASWIIRLDEQGNLLGIEDNRVNTCEGKTDRKGKPLKARWAGRDTLVPIQAIRTSGDAAAFMVDKAEYVLGVAIGGDRPVEKLSNRLSLFYAALERCAQATADPQVHAAVAFGRRLQSMSPAERSALAPAELGPSDLLMFRVGANQDPLHLQSAVKAYWKQLRNPGSSASGNSKLRCLITGEAVQGTVPLFRLLKNVPGGTSSGVSLVSFNAPAWESHGWKSNENAPFCREAAEAAATALNRLLDPSPTDGEGKPLPVRRIRLSDDTVVVFWSPEPAADVQSVLDAIPDLMDPPDDVRDVGNLFASVRHGALRELQEPGRFYAMTLTGTQGRVVVRDWLESSVADVQRNLWSHFEALLCVRNTPPSKGRPPRAVLSLRELLDSLAAPGRDGKVPASLAADFVHAALRGTAYPFSILQRAVLRARAEARASEWTDAVRRDARASLIKAVLNRRRAFYADAAQRYPEVTPHMDPNSMSDGYNLGVLLAVMERLQAEALGDINASLVDKYFAAASATPRVVFDRLLKGARHHARKAADGPSSGRAFWLERLLDELVARFGPPGGFPVSLDLEQQGLFVIGYHHGRRFLWMSREERAAWEADHADAPRVFKTGRSEPQPATA